MHWRHRGAYRFPEALLHVTANPSGWQCLDVPFAAADAGHPYVRAILLADSKLKSPAMPGGIRHALITSCPL